MSPGPDLFGEPESLTGPGEVPLRIHDYDRLRIGLLTQRIAPGQGRLTVQLVSGGARNLGRGDVPGNLQVHVVLADEPEVRPVAVIVIRVGLPTPAEGMQDVV